jgi:hypothetical protein
VGEGEKTQKVLEKEEASVGAEERRLTAVEAFEPAVAL